MAQYTDEEIIESNNGKIIPGDYFIFPGYIDIFWKSHNINSVNIFYEKNLNGNTEEVIVAENIKCSITEINTYKINLTALSANANSLYPEYRIKIVDSETENLITYSNKFKVSVENITEG